MEEDGTDWPKILEAKGIQAPLTADRQYKLALAVTCPWRKCMAAAGERCNATLIFPQYPHTSRLQAAALAA